jgi:hypothetical protein
MNNEDWCDRPLYLALCAVVLVGTILVSIFYPWGWQ